MRIPIVFFLMLTVTRAAAAQTPPAKEPPPLWDVQVGASFVGTSGNSDTASVGADFAAHRRGLVWRIDSTANAVRASSNDVKTAERYLGQVQGARALTAILGLTAGGKLERDRFSGIDFRAILNGGLSWALVRSPAWTLDGITGLAWNHESPIIGPARNDPVGLLQLLSRIPFAAGSETTERITFYPDLSDTSAARTEAELTAQAAMNSRLALKAAYLIRYSNEPVPGFKKTDTSATASIVLRWKADTPAPR